MKQLGLVAGVALVAVLGGSMLTRLSSDALGMAIGVMFGVLAGIPSALLVLATSRRRDRDDEYDADRHALPPPYVQGPPYPYQPPVIVLAGLVAQEPQTVNNYTDNRSVTIHTPAAGGMPLLADREREVRAQQGGRVFRVVGEQEWGD